MSVLKRKIKKRLRFFWDYTQNLRFINKDLSLEDKNVAKTLLVFTHELSKTGAPLLLLHIVKALYKRGWNIILISQSPGVLAKDFSNYVSSFYICTNRYKFKNKLEDFNLKGVNKALVNTVICGEWCSILKTNKYKVVSLVHELPNVIKCWDATSSAQTLKSYSDEVVFPSNFVADNFNELINCESSDNYHIFTQGLYLKPNKNLNKDESRYVLNKRYTLDNKPVILNVASGNHRKGFDLFVSMATKAPEYNFIWVGDYDKKLIKNVEIRDVHNLHLPGYINDGNELSMMYSGADVLALTSREEPFGSIVLESMFAGTPVVGFKNAGGFQDVVIDGYTGFLADFEDIDDMINKISLIIKKDTYKELSKNAHDMSLNFNFPIYVDKLVKLIE